MNNFDLILLNDVTECEGTYTWSSRNSKSVIDYCLVSNKLHEKFVSMKIDENKEEIDLSDHNLITTNFQVCLKSNTTARQLERKVITYLKINEETSSEFLREVDKVKESEYIK